MWLTTNTSAKWQVLEAEKDCEFDVAGGRDYFTVMEELAEADALPTLTARAPDGHRGPAGIDFDSVSFGYPGCQDVLREVTFSIRQREHIAFVGEAVAARPRSSACS
jgi:ABC-type multidrug transport system fused ATPase/permease subunit